MRGKDFLTIQEYLFDRQTKFVEDKLGQIVKGFATITQPEPLASYYPNLHADISFIDLKNFRFGTILRVEHREDSKVPEHFWFVVGKADYMGLFVYQIVDGDKLFPLFIKSTEFRTQDVLRGFLVADKDALRVDVMSGGLKAWNEQ